MKIAINTRILLRNRLEGIGWYTYEICRRLVRDHPDDTFYFLFDRPYDPSFVFGPNVVPLHIWPPARHPVLFRIWFDWALPRVLRRIQPDVFFSPDGFCSLRYPGKTLLTIHDLAYKHYPEAMPAGQLGYYRTYMPRFIERADRIVAISQATAADIAAVGGPEAAAKTRVVYNGGSELYSPLDEDARREARNAFANGRRYFLFVGALHPRKNVRRLLEAYERFRDHSGDQADLVLAGRMAWQTDEIRSVLERSKYRSSIHFTGHIDMTRLLHLMGGALCLVYPSLLEGFGLPVLEGFKAGVPVITSNVSSMAEIAADGAILVDPFSVDAIAQAMQQVAATQELRDRLIGRGLARAQDFSWDDCADGIYTQLNELYHQ